MGSIIFSIILLLFPKELIHNIDKHIIIVHVFVRSDFSPIRNGSPAFYIAPVAVRNSQGSGILIWKAVSRAAMSYKARAAATSLSDYFYAIVAANARHDIAA